MANELTPDEVEVDLDLVELDSKLREAVGKPTAVRLTADSVVHIAHIAEWNGAAMKAASAGDWDSWAAEVIIDDKELAAWQDADLANYQIEAVFEQCARSGNMSSGKSRRSGPSSRRTKRR